MTPTDRKSTHSPVGARSEDSEAAVPVSRADTAAFIADRLGAARRARASFIEHHVERACERIVQSLETARRRVVEDDPAGMTARHPTR